MRIAYTISSYRLYDFVKLGILQLKRIDPHCPILISDDESQETPYIKQLAEETGVDFLGSDTKRGHFAGDLQGMVNSIAFAQAVGADVAVKISQRFVLRLPEACDVIRSVFSDEGIAMALPGQPKSAGSQRASQGFRGMAVLSDIVAFRPSLFPPERMIEIYKRRLSEEIVPWKAFIEAAAHEAQMNLGPAARTIPQLTDHTDTRNPIYLRRYQNSEDEYRRLAASHGFGGKFPTVEWGLIEGRMYQANPVVV